VVYDIVLQGKQGTGKVRMQWFNQHIDAALFPLLLPRGQFTFGNVYYI